MAAAESFVEGMTFEELEGDQRTQFALQRAFEIIGEATKQLDDTLRHRYSDIHWQKMAGMRDVLIHGYFAVDLEIVWDTVHHRFPQEKPRIRRALEELSE
ncbi:MAG: DUF86 domain-containing protein [Salinivenus sp.]